MYKVFLSLRQLKNQALPTVKISFSSEYPFSSRFCSFIHESFSVIEERYFIDDDFSDEVFDVYLYPRDMNLDALIDFLNFINHRSTIIYKSNFDFTALYNFEQDLMKILSVLPF